MAKLINTEKSWVGDTYPTVPKNRSKIIIKISKIPKKFKNLHKLKKSQKFQKNLKSSTNSKNLKTFREKIWKKIIFFQITRNFGGKLWSKYEVQFVKIIFIFLDLISFWRAFQCRFIPFISAKEFLAGLYATDPDANHGGKTGRLRTQMIYKYYSKDQKMTFEEFKTFYAETRSTSQIEPTDEDFKLACSRFKLPENERTNGPVVELFVDTIGKKIPKIQQQKFQENSKNISKKNSKK